MLGRTYDDQNCSAARALEVVGERWSLLILRDALFRRMTRFSEFQRSLNVAPNILTARLQMFVREGLMELAPQREGAGQPRYLLTDKGRDLGPVILALIGWGDRWAAPDGPPVLFGHDDGCLGPVGPVTMCAACGHEVAGASLHVRPGPGARPRPPA